MDVDGMSEVLYGTLACVSADNIASNLLGGVKESGSACRPCRHCIGTREECKTMVSVCTL